MRKEKKKKDGANLNFFSARIYFQTTSTSTYTRPTVFTYAITFPIMVTFFSCGRGGVAYHPNSLPVSYSVTSYNVIDLFSATVGVRV